MKITSLFLSFVVVKTVLAELRQEYDCYTEKGVEYKGTVATAGKTGPSCVKWNSDKINLAPDDLAQLQNHLKSLDGNFDHNYCRNFPGESGQEQESTPWCFVDSEEEWASCSHILRCDDPCLSNACKNGARCKRFAKGTGFRCICKKGFTGKLCETNIDDCANNPCVNGKCVDKVAAYQCQCDPGWKGKNCDTEIDECREPSNPCKNGAGCLDLLNDFKCTCTPGFTGKTCEKDIDECASTPCLNNATCENKLNSYSCKCAFGYKGRRCEQEINPCDSFPCANGGSCEKNGPGRYQCVCKPGTDGPQCQIGVLRSRRPVVTGCEGRNWCTSVKKCFSNHERCDGVNDCGDWSDEANCTESVHGGWSAWNQWNICTKSCGTGTRLRSRTCSNPPPSNNGGKKCLGSNNDIETCNSQPCPVDGGFSTWTAWTECSKSCDGGKSLRFRNCSNPTPKFGGKKCIGEQDQGKNCNDFECPSICDLIPYKYLRSNNSVTIKEGKDVIALQKKHTITLGKKMVIYANTRMQCLYDMALMIKHCLSKKEMEELKKDNAELREIYKKVFGYEWLENSTDATNCTQKDFEIEPTGRWTKFTEFAPCNTGCGSGHRIRTRICEGYICSGLPVDKRTCYTRAYCTGSFSFWSGWSECSEQCGPGLRSKRRYCINDGRIDKRAFYCDGNITHTSQCVGTYCLNANKVSLSSKQFKLNSSCQKGFLCQTGVCISKDRVCDGVNDCLDQASGKKGSDEACCDDWVKWVSLGLALLLLLIVFIICIVLCCTVLSCGNSNKVESAES